jgi:hypothetical protein
MTENCDGSLRWNEFTDFTHRVVDPYIEVTAETS